MSLAVTPEPQNPTNGSEIEEIKMAFNKFDVVSDASDHHYFVDKHSTKKSTGQDCFVNAASSVYKKVIQEWRILERNLPESIFVRVYENRIDLLQAVIIGAAGTPYHDGLYFFDLAFPIDYPHRPPLVHYHSFGMRINPNLYENGRVCLSLLNTWSGKKCEKWNANESTVLQVLVSIQALVLNEKPYYNEPGVLSGRVKWDKKSMAYNENVFVLSCKTMLCLLRNPPKNFEDFVAGHFRERAEAIISACNAYMNGRAMVAYYRNDGGDGSSSLGKKKVYVSDKFKGLVDKLYPQLVAAFTKNGTPLSIFYDQAKVEIKAGSFNDNHPRVVVKKKGTIGILKRVFGRVKVFLGLNKKADQGSRNDVKKES
ncbi:putative ubiquitin-conjugating enzyme E2 38 [Tripterygium wilfordii]|uniref:Putative ubiquitin-conjugating enzyme E2 38 n=1 Tax=Tripterygium wilfordii TaxID=458696 RepID=A0A7J7CXE5_TRIWF|nr:putative ubiquitin-conjugating enzyme E2 39 [Tripterygium wilfordii]KAF5738771.1 putative ubiquitin-conjugating enzyme E2 38 [Tripterygium wilfordii]